jgi:stage III sporulation protein AD
MEIVHIVGLGFVAAILLVLLRQQRPELATQLSIAVGAIIFVLMIGRILSVVNVLDSLAQRAKIGEIYLATVLKIVGVAYVADFGAQVLRDSGEGAVASKVEMAGKIIILMMAVPIIIAITETLLKMLA